VTFVIIVLYYNSFLLDTILYGYRQLSVRISEIDQDQEVKPLAIARLADAVLFLRF